MDDKEKQTNDPNDDISHTLKCELELIPVVAGECRAEPSIATLERSLIRSSSAEVQRHVLKTI